MLKNINERQYSESTSIAYHHFQNRVIFSIPHTCILVQKRGWKPTLNKTPIILKQKKALSDFQIYNSKKEKPFSDLDHQVG